MGRISGPSSPTTTVDSGDFRRSRRLDRGLEKSVDTSPGIGKSLGPKIRTGTGGLPKI
jgi:hypothetical protein